MYLVESYERLALPFADFEPYLLEEAERQGLPLSEFFGPTGHYNDAGNAQLTSFARRHFVGQFLIWELSTRCSI